MGVYKRGKIWWVAYGNGNGRQIRESSGSNKKADALAVLEKKRTEVREGKQPIKKRNEDLKRSTPEYSIWKEV